MNLKHKSLDELTYSLAEFLCKKKLMLATAESCTGGAIAKSLTDLPGSSRWFERGFITYSGLAKQELLGVQISTLKKYGEVSEETVLEMAKGAIQRSRAQVSIAVTGIAGPSGGSLQKPVGLVWFGFSISKNLITTRQQLFQGQRKDIRDQAVIYAIEVLLQLLEKSA